MQQGLFRRPARDCRASPERLDELMEVTPPGSWLALAGLLGLLVAALLWGLFGSVPTLVRSDGVLIRDGSLQTVDASAVGEVKELFARAGDDVARDQVI